MILFFYNLALILTLVLGAPWWLFRVAATRKYRTGLLPRLGKVPARIRDQAADPTRPVIWMHAVSVGEVLAVSRLVEELGRIPGYRVFISTTTLTGHALASSRFGMNRVFYCPLDLPWAVTNYVKALQPRLLILVETEFWPNLLTACFRKGVPVAVVNARISDRSWPRYHRLRRLWRPILERLSLVQAQTQTDAERLKAIGCRPERVLVAGNLKFDVRADLETGATRQLRSRTAGLKLIVAGSTLEGEEAALLGSWVRIRAADPDVALILAPRHPERFGAVETLLDQAGVAWQKRSEWKSQAVFPVDMPLNSGQVILLDTIGELASVYSLASVAFVGGSLVPAGGHNPLEPAQFGVPVVMGPHYANFRAITEDLRARDAICIVSQAELDGTLIQLLQDRAFAEAMGERARNVFNGQAGATARCVAAIQGLLLADLIPERHL